MRFPIKLFTLLVLALLATSAVAWKPISKGDAEACRKKNPDIAQVIGSFCQRFPMVNRTPWTRRLESYKLTNTVERT
jgi:hypothetical protein